MGIKDEENKKIEIEEEEDEDNCFSVSSCGNKNEFKNFLYLIKNKRDLERNRTRRENYYYNNDIGIKKLKNTIINIRQRRANTFKK